MDLDANGNVYVTGQSDSTLSFIDIVTIKYTSGGVLRWKVRYASDEHHEDVAYAIAVDRHGNVYVGGVSFSRSTSYDFVTIKYDSNGVRQWVALYNGPDSDFDILTSLAVDTSGNVFVGGGSFVSNGSYDYLTIKYNSDGVEQWTRRYNGPGSFDDGVNALALDQYGNVYVTGFSNSGSSPDVTTIKYDTDGAEQWIKTYDGPTNGVDEAYAIKVDTSGSVYIVGYSQGSNSYDFLTIRYGQDGSDHWVSRYNGPQNSVDVGMGFGVDHSGHVFVAGRSYGNSDVYFDCVTVKYDSNGTEQWVRRENPGTKAAELYDAAVDPAGNVSVVGFVQTVQSSFDFYTIKYAPNGTKLWEVLYDGPRHNIDIGTCVATDVLGNTIIAGTSEGLNTYNDYAVIRYSPLGGQDWVRRYNGIGSSSESMESLHVNKSGDTYLGIDSQSQPDSGTVHSMLLVKVSPAGDTLWTRAYQDASLAPNSGMTLDSTGNVYMTGTRSGNIVTIKYTPDGSQAWSRVFSVNLGECDARSIGVDAKGNIYVGGRARYDTSGLGLFTEVDFVMLKYASSGSLLWSSEHSSMGAGLNEAVKLVVTGSSDVILAGYGSPGSMITKWDANGAKKWLKIGAGSPQDIAVDDSENVYVTGANETSKRFPDGTLAWSKPDGGLSIAVGPLGNVYVTKNWASGAIEKYLPNGSMDWSTLPQVGDGIFMKVCTDACGNIVATSLQSAATTYKLNPAGQLQWRYSWTPFNTFSPGKPFIDVDAEGKVYIAGSAPLGNGAATAAYLSRLDPIPTLGLSQDTISFGQVSLTCMLEDTVTLGSSLCGTTHQYSVASTDSSFTVIPIDTASRPTSTFRFLVRFHPSTPGIRTGIVTFAHSASNSTASLHVSGVGATGHPAYSAMALTFSSTAVGCRATQSFMIKNLRCTPLTIKSAIPDGIDFVVDPESTSIDPLDSASFVVTFEPLTMGAKIAHIIMGNNQSVLLDSVALGGTATGSGAEFALIDTFGLGWQLISNPVTSACPLVLPSSFLFNHGYARVDTIQPGRGYWNKLRRTKLAFAGSPISSSNAAIDQGWNIIGSISGTVLATDVQTIPTGIMQSPLYGFSPSGDYQIADTIRPGHAYWLKSSQSGTLVLSTASSPPLAALPQAPSAVSNTLLSLATASRITVTDGAGHVRTLYFKVAGEAQQIEMLGLELPPPTPSGGFDVRFASGALLQIIRPTVNAVLPIVWTGVDYPIRFRFDLRDGPTALLLQIGSSGYAVTDGAEIVSSEAASVASLKITQPSRLPKMFELTQNYPNPFNPSTTIGYSLPVESKVLLTVYNILGQRVRTLVDAVEDSGFKRVTLDSSELTSGVYFYRIQAGTFTDSKKLLLMR
jgi:uncharacterized delta-60 repeat protein